MNVLKLLKKDHSAVKALFREFDGPSKAAREARGGMFEDLRRQLQVHSRAEREIFYPALKALNDIESRKLVPQALREHQEIDELLTQLSRLKPSDRPFEEKMETLIEKVEDHIDEEEREIFRFAEDNCSQEYLEELGRQMDERKKILDRQIAA